MTPAGAIIGRHIDVFRPPPSNPNLDHGGFATGQRVYIVARASRFLSSARADGVPFDQQSRARGAGGD